MAFCSFSKDCDGNSFVTVENKFITKYLPEADGFAVKVYLYGLYLCKTADSDFGLKSMAEVLKTTETQIMQAFEFWQDYDLVEILSKEPFAVQYLPVKSTVHLPPLRERKDDIPALAAYFTNKQCEANALPTDRKSTRLNSSHKS